MVKFWKKVLTLVVTTAMISAFSMQGVLAKGEVLERDINITIKQGRYKAPDIKSISTYSVSNYNDFFNAMEDSIGKIEDSVKLVFENGYLKNNVPQFKKSLEKIISIVGTGCYIDSYAAYLSTENGKDVYTVKYEYEKGIADARKKDNEVNKAVSSIIPKIITPSMSIYEKEKAIHDYIINNTRYDIENLEKNTLPVESHTPYGVFVNKVAVCDGYASAMKKMFDVVGIENLIVVGDSSGVPHAWNLVKLYGKWHHVDATWDDPIVYEDGKYKNILSHEFFNKSDEYMKNTHNWILSDYPKAESQVVSNKKGKRFIDDRYL